MEAFINIKQTSIEAVYKTQFELLSNQVRGLLDSHKLSCFLEGLKEEIMMRVRMLNPKNLVATYGLARMLEENLAIMKGSWKPSSMGFQGKNSTPALPKAEGRLVLIQRLTSV